MSDGQVYMLILVVLMFVLWGGLLAFETWLDIRTIRRDPVIRDLRTRLNDNERPELDAQPLVSTDSAKESA